MRAPLIGKTVSERTEVREAADRKRIFEDNARKAYPRLAAKTR